MEFELSKLLPFSINAVNTVQFPLNHLPMVNITSVTASDMYRRRPCSASKNSTLLRCSSDRPDRPKTPYFLNWVAKKVKEVKVNELMKEKKTVTLKNTE